MCFVIWSYIFQSSILEFYSYKRWSPLDDFSIPFFYLRRQDRFSFQLSRAYSRPIFRSTIERPFWRKLYKALLRYKTRRKGIEYWGGYLVPFFFKKVPFLANIERCPNFLEYAQLRSSNAKISTQSKMCGFSLNYSVCFSVNILWNLCVSCIFGIFKERFGP